VRGWSDAEIAVKFALSAGRISQIIQCHLRAKRSDMLKMLSVVAVLFCSLSAFAEPPFPDVAAKMLKCLHPTAQFRTADLVETPWRLGKRYQADASWLIRIDCAGGLTNEPYQADIGLVSRPSSLAMTNTPLAERETELLLVPNDHVVFTLPASIGDIAYHCPISKRATKKRETSHQGRKRI
jgi:hypothetical protein